MTPRRTNHIGPDVMVGNLLETEAQLVKELQDYRAYIGRVMRFKRKELLGMSLTDMTRRAGVEQSELSRLERGERWRREYAEACAVVLDGAAP